MNGAIIAYVGSILLLMSFCAPYWIESFDSSFSSFKNMGLWEYCFKDFYYPYYQFPRKFNGCHNIFSHVSRALPASRPDLWMKGWNNIWHLLLLAGILCHSWIFGACMAVGHPSLRHRRLPPHFLCTRCARLRNGPMAIENRAAIWIYDDQSCLLVPSRSK